MPFRAVLLVLSPPCILNSFGGNLQDLYHRQMSSNSCWKKRSLGQSVSGKTVGVIAIKPNSIGKCHRALAVEKIWPGLILHVPLCFSRARDYFRKSGAGVHGRKLRFPDDADDRFRCLSQNLISVLIYRRAACRNRYPDTRAATPEAAEVKVFLQPSPQIIRVG